eukprot:TRINITY_DN1965_c0_g1_i1.p1 TRINITY_DN1965_c0_g1~~TRINITY_DN1965_c0_g1_i1.p1  ORF type:complete len:328 (-),score=103.79 TRINITY_DN1965_c0_g1_i1:1150-2133(-)
MAKGLVHNESIVFLNLSGNSIYNRGAEVLLNALKTNKTIRKVMLLYNCLGERIIREIDSKTYSNGFYLQKRRVPKYQTMLSSLVINDEARIKVKTESTKMQELRAEVEAEFREKREEFRGVKERELKLYENVRQNYTNIMMKDKKVSIELEKAIEEEEAIKKKYESEIDAIDKKIKALTYSANKIKKEIESYKAAISEKKQQSINIIQELSEEYEEIFRKRARNAKKEENKATEEKSLDECKTSAYGSESKSLGGRNELALTKKELPSPIFKTEEKDNAFKYRDSKLYVRSAKAAKSVVSVGKQKKPGRKAVKAKRPKKVNLNKTLK